MRAHGERRDRSGPAATASSSSTDRSPPRQRRGRPELLLRLALGIGGFSAVVRAVAWYAFERLDESLATGADPFLYGQYLLAVVALGTFGVAVGRWIPTVLGGPSSWSRTCSPA